MARFGGAMSPVQQRILIMKSDFQWTDPFNAAGIEQMADWMAHRFGQSPIYRIAIGSGDAELLATVMADLMAEYLAEIGYDARVRRDRNFVTIATGDDDDGSRREHNISIPLARAVMHRLHGPGPYGPAAGPQPFV